MPVDPAAARRGRRAFTLTRARRRHGRDDRLEPIEQDLARSSRLLEGLAVEPQLFQGNSGARQQNKREQSGQEPRERK
jgi:hypothetical protein